jgi:hypothetical protein
MQEQQELTQNKTPTAEQPIQKDTRIVGSATEGLVGAIASTAMSLVAIVMTLLLPLNFISEMLCMYGFILGVRAIGDAKSATLWQQKKPKATFVLGVIGVVVNSLTMLLWLLWIVGYFILLMTS